MIVSRRSVGRFVAGGSFWHGTDPRAKLALVTATAVALARPDDPLLLCGIAATPLFLGIAGGISARTMASPLLSLAWLLAFTASGHIFLVPGAPLLAGFPGSREGLVSGIAAVARLSGMLLAVQIMVVSTSALRLARGIEALADPVPLVRRIARGFPMVFSLTLRFVPLLLEEWEKLRESATLRGYLGPRVPLSTRLAREAGLLVPLFIVSFRKAEEMALSMHLRGYRAGERRSALHPLAAGPRDLLVVGAATAAAAAVWIA
jgi:energy-coupling factor transport system permease protein